MKADRITSVLRNGGCSTMYDSFVKKIERHQAYIDAKLEEYNLALENADNDNKNIIEEQIEKHHYRKKFYNNLSDQLQETGQVQISTSDPESRQLITRNNITEVGYNEQTTVDVKYCISIDYRVSNENDSKALGAPTTQNILTAY